MGEFRVLVSTRSLVCLPYCYSPPSFVLKCVSRSVLLFYLTLMYVEQLSSLSLPNAHEYMLCFSFFLVRKFRRSDAKFQGDDEDD